jgi:hypothetical protein
MHLDDEQVQRTLHGELTAAHAGVREHLDRCDECRARVAHEAREERRLFEVLGAIDRPAPAVTIARVVARAGQRRRWRTRVAAIVLGLAVTGVAYAAPGSPLPDLVKRLLGPSGGASRPGPSSSRPTAEPVAGIAVVPGSRFTIELTSLERDAVATVSLTDGPEVVVRAFGGKPSFVSDVDRLEIRDGNDVRAIEIEIPRRAPSLEILWGNRQLLRKRGATVVAEGTRDAAGRYVMRPTAGGS